MSNIASQGKGQTLTIATEKLKLKHTTEINNMKAIKTSRRSIFRSGTERSELLQHSGRGMGYFILVIPLSEDSFNVRLSRRDILQKNA